MTKQAIIIKEAAEHNLKSVSLEIPHNALVVITGVSGSGKSSLAHDIIFKEGQKRYLETFSGFARQYLGKLSRANVSHISGLRPALAVDQKSVIKNPRSTVGTMSEIYDYLRLLYSRFGEKKCPYCEHSINVISKNELFEQIIETYKNKKISFAAPVTEGHKGVYNKILNDAVKDGFLRFQIDGKMYSASNLPELDKKKPHNIDFVFSECDVNQANHELLEKTFYTCLRFGKDKIKVIDSSKSTRYSLLYACSNCNKSLPEYGPRLFSFNSDYGACPSCKGLGVEDEIAEDLLIEDNSKTLREGALVITTPTGYIIYSQVTMDVMNQVCVHHGFNVDIPWKDLNEAQKRIVLYGSNEIKIPYGKHTLESRMKWSGITARPREEGFYKGIIPVMEEILKRDRNPNILRFARTVSCKKCKGKRINLEARSVKINQKDIAELSALTINELELFLKKVHVPIEKEKIWDAITEPIFKRVKILTELGLGYLSLNRESTQLSGGEAQRIRLATQAVSGLRGMIYVLDEPSIGLHPKDSIKMIEVLKTLRDNGNTVIIVEHDEDIIRQADYIIDFGPYAGIRGGELLYSGSLKDFLSKTNGQKQSLTHQFLTRESQSPLSYKHRPGKAELKIIGAHKNNLKNINLRFKTEALNVVSGVSGSGKKSLVKDILVKNILLAKKEQNAAFINCESIIGLEHIAKVVEIDQAPIGKTPRSNPATYTGMFDHIRDMYAELPESKEKKWKKGRFSFNVKGGRCETCQGAGLIQTGMHFLGNVDVPCEDCGGMRFNDDTLSVKLMHKTIYEVLEMSFDEAKPYFTEHKKISNLIDVLIELGLGYIKLGQPSTTLSGGEAQRIKLATELGKASTGKTVYILDEPTTGLHFYDVEILLKVLHKIVDSGNTIIAIEHHPAFILAGDWLVELGPGSGKEGGNVIFQGKPGNAIKDKNSIMGVYLQTELPKEKQKKAKKIVNFPIQLEGVNTHNLKNINVEIPQNKLTVITGLSGSGKSSLAFDTIFAESQHRYLENLSTFSRRFMNKLQKANVYSAKGLSPAIAISQNNYFTNPRSTLGTITEIYDYYRLLFSRAGSSEKKQLYSAQDFSFNYHKGACTACRGLGIQIICDPEKLITHPEKSILNGAMNGTKTGKFYGELYGQYVAVLKAVGRQKAIDFNIPWQSLPEKAKTIVLEGTQSEQYHVKWEYKRKERTGVHEFTSRWPGLKTYINEEYERKHADSRGNEMLNVMKEVKCSLCEGRQLNNNVLQVKVANRNIAELASLSVKESHALFIGIKENPTLNHITTKQAILIEGIVEEIISRLQVLMDLGLGYLRINRKAPTLSGGEAQRVRLASLVGSELTGISFIFDEPSTGLHPRDIQKLTKILLQLRDRGNTVILVEHEKDIIKLADHIIDLGPGAGKQGGEIVASGSFKDIILDRHSITGRYLSGNKKIEVDKMLVQDKYNIIIKGAYANNLKDLNLTVPFPGMVVLTGVSGSGKSSLLFDVIEKTVQQKKPVNCKQIMGLENFHQVIGSRQQSIGTSPLSTPVTYLGIFDRIRELMAQTNDAKLLKFEKAVFSFNNKKGQCTACNGMGKVKNSMDFLADIWAECEECHGKRYNSQVLSILYRGKSIDDILRMTISEAKSFYNDERNLFHAFELLEETGLGYLQLGQASDTLSGGEAQRLKLAASLLTKETKRKLYLIDEPTTGLHFSDIQNLLLLFHKLRQQGHALIVIEHNQDIIRHADWVVDLGPEGGEAGGDIVFQGNIDSLLKCKASHTGKCIHVAEL